MGLFKQAGAIPAILSLLLFSSCGKEPSVVSVQGGEMGAISLALSQDNRVATKAEAASLPEVDAFRVEIYNSKAIRLYNQKYETAKSEVIKLNAGTYRMVAHYGDTLGCGIHRPYYLADVPFEVLPSSQTDGKPQSVKAVAKLANVQLAVNFGENMKGYYPDYYALVKHETLEGKAVKFSKTETRTGNIPGGNLYLEVYAVMPSTSPEAGKLKYYKTEATQYNPNDFVTFNLDINPVKGNLTVNIQVDNSVDVIEKEFVLPSGELPGKRPSFSMENAGGEYITGNAFDVEFEAANPNVKGGELSFLAAAGVKSVSITVDCTYANDILGLGTTAIDLANVTEQDAAALASAGISYLVDTDARMGYIAVTELLKKLATEASYDLGENSQVGTVKVTVIDNSDRVSEAQLALKAVPMTVTTSYLDYNVWGWKVVDIEAEVPADGVLTSTDVISLEWKLPSETKWKSVKAKSVNGRKAVFGDVTGLKPGTAYEFRTSLGNYAGNVCAQPSITTEDGAQPGNVGFEELTSQLSETEITWGLGSTFKVTWWQLYADGETDPWWAVNATRTIADEVTLLYQDYKTYPTVAVIGPNNGSWSGNSVMVATIARDNVGSEVLSGDPHVGEIFIGKANDALKGDWAKVSEGHSHGSRPSHLGFMYKFDIHKNPFVAEISVHDIKGDQIGYGVLNNVNNDVNDWTEAKVPVTYTVTNRKAASVKVSFRSETTEDGSHKVTVNTLSGEHKIHAGSILCLDDVRFLYE